MGAVVVATVGSAVSPGGWREEKWVFFLAAEVMAAVAVVVAVAVDGVGGGGCGGGSGGGGTGSGGDTLLVQCRLSFLQCFITSEKNNTRE